jgi:MGT family glycosyltransferase
MSTVLIYTSPARGHLYPMMDVALALQAGGHRVVVQSLAAERDHVHAAGIEHRPLAPAIEGIELADHRARGTRAQLQAALDCWATRAPHEVDDLGATLSDLSPDLVVVDANTWGAAALARAQGRPWAMFLPYCLPVPSADAPAFGPGFAPPRNGLHRMRDRAVWAAQHRLSAPAVDRLNALRGQLGVPPLAGLPELYLDSDALLYRTAEPFEYHRRDWPANVHMIGPGLWSPPAQPPDWLAALPHPRVLVSVSTELQRDGAIITAALDGLADEPGSLIVTTAALDPAEFRAPNDRTRIVRFLSHAAVIQSVDVVVTHGGMGTTQRALAAGVPLVVVPWGRDQGESARRVEHSGAGVRLSPRHLSADRMRDAVRTALSQAPGAGRVAAGLADAGGPSRAVEILEGLMASVPGTRP